MTARAADPRPWSLPADAARAVVATFFDRYAEHDVDGMADLCALDADFDYVPVEFRSKQGVQRARGLARSTGKVMWQGLISSFPDLSLALHTMTANDDGDVVVQADLAGTQARPWGFVAAAGRHYREAHLFVFHVGADQLIDSIAAYWNEAGVHEQLGHREVD